MTLSTSLQTLRQKLTARANQGVVSQATTAGSISTLIDTARGRGIENRTDYWINSVLKIYSGTGSGSEVTVTSFNPTTGTFTFSPTVSSATSASTAYELHKVFSPTQLNDAINAAVAQGFPAWFSPVRDITTVTTTSALEYTLPSTIEQLLEVEMEISSSLPPQILQNWKHDTAANKLVLGTLPLSGKKLYLHGVGRPSQLSSDTDTTPVHPEFIYKVAALELQLSQYFNSPQRDMQREANLINMLGSAVTTYRRVFGMTSTPSAGL